MIVNKPTAIEVYRKWEDAYGYSHSPGMCVILDALKLAAVMEHERTLATEPHPKYGRLHQVAYLLDARWLTTDEAFAELYPEVTE